MWKIRGGAGSRGTSDRRSNALEGTVSAGTASTTVATKAATRAQHVQRAQFSGQGSLGEPAVDSVQSSAAIRISRSVVCSVKAPSQTARQSRATGSRYHAKRSFLVGNHLMHGHLTDRRIREGEAWAAIFSLWHYGLPAHSDTDYGEGFGVFLTVRPTEHRM
jgi:hypothetical protein